MNPVVVIGAGLAGLTAARILSRAGMSVRVVEATGHVGGRVRTREVQGFTLDVGYQVLFTAYPAVKRHLDLGRLDLVHLKPGAVIHRHDRVERVGDPIRDPGSLVADLTSTSLGARDKWLVAKLAATLAKPAPHELLRERDGTTLDYLRDFGFSYAAIDHFFAPFFGGILLKRNLSPSASLFKYYFRMLMQGATAVPRSGMGEIPRQLAEDLNVTPNMRVRALRPHAGGVTVHTELGDIEASSVIVATDPPDIARLTGARVPMEGVGSTYLYYAADVQLDDEARLLLNAAGGLVNHAAWVSNALPERAPAGKHLLTVTVLGVPELTDPHLDHAVRAELSRWYGPDEVTKLTLLRVDRLPFAQFAQPPGFSAGLAGHGTRMPGVLIASEATSMSSIQGAMESGEKAAAILLGDVRVLSRPRGA